MNWNKLALCGAVAGSIAAVGCGSTPATNDTGTGGGNDAAVMTMEPVTVTYIVDTITIPPGPTGAMMNITPGFNLDGKVSVEGGAGNCEDAIGDYNSPSGETGVDNQLVGVLLGVLVGFLGDLDVQATVDEQISTGSLLLAVEVNDIESFENDPDGVTLDLFLVDPAGCAMSPCPPMGGAVAGGASWVQQAGMPLATGLRATIVDGVLTGGPIDLPLSFEASGTMITLTIRDAGAGGGKGGTGMGTGPIGGGLRVADAAMPAEGIMPGIGETARGLLEMYADLSPSTADPLLCDSISAGIAFTAVEGTVE